MTTTGEGTAARGALLGRIPGLEEDDFELLARYARPFVRRDADGYRLLLALCLMEEWPQLGLQGADDLALAVVLLAQDEETYGPPH